MTHPDVLAKDARVDRELAALDDALHEKARRLLIELHADYAPSVTPSNRSIRLVLNVLRDTLRDGVIHAEDSALAQRLIEQGGDGP